MTALALHAIAAVLLVIGCALFTATGMLIQQKERYSASLLLSSAVILAAFALQVIA